MSKCQMLRLLVKQRLTAAAEEIFGLFERSIAEYEEELSRSKEENERQQKLLDAVFNPQLHLHRADVQQLLVVKEEVPPEQQEWSSRVDQEDPEPPHIKEEQEELWIAHKGEQLLEEADIKFTPVAVKSEDDEEKPQTSQLHQRQTEQMETDGEDCGGPEPDRSSDPDTHLQPETEDKTGDCPEPETEDKTGDCPEPETEDSDDYWKENIDKRLVSDSCAAEKTFSCSVCGKRFSSSGNVRAHMRTHTGEKPFSCNECGKRFVTATNLKRHMRSHTGEKPFRCSLCEKSYTQGGNFQKHMRGHRGEKPFSCSQCEKRFRAKTDLKRHMSTHTGEKPFSCSECGTRFVTRAHLKRHMIYHTADSPFSCSVCKKPFTLSGDLKTHMSTHTGEKLFSCLVCKKSFNLNGNLKKHMRCHTGEKPFSCCVCDQRFTWSYQLKKHRCAGRQSAQPRLNQTEESGEPPASSSTDVRSYICYDA